MESPSRCPPNVIQNYVSEDVKSTDRRDVHFKAEAKGREDQKSSHLQPVETEARCGTDDIRTQT